METTKMKCLLLDDELPGLKYLRLICEQISEIEVIKAYNDPLKFIAEYAKIDFDFCIMDIEMPHHNGLEIAELIRPKPVIFITAYNKYAADAFDMEAIDYIRKPIQQERLKKAIGKIKERLPSRDQGQKEILQWNTNKGKSVLIIEQIILLKVSDVDPRDKVALLDNGEEIVLKNISFDHLINQLPIQKFCRINKKTILALKCVHYYSHDEITTHFAISENNSLQLSLSDTYKKDFEAKLKR